MVILTKEMVIFSPQGMLGYGYPMKSLENGLAYHPDVIAVDAGSTDGGPHRLGMGIGGVSDYATKKDLIPLIKAAKERNIPLIIGSAGGSGANERVDALANIVDEIGTEEDLELRTTCIYADISIDTFQAKWKQGHVMPCGVGPTISERIIDDTMALVGQMGVEPFIEALKEQPDIIIAGRAYDPVLFAALPILKGYDEALSLHLGKILECGALAATPGTAKDGMIGILRDDHFLVVPTNDERACTVESVAAHTLYEKSHPYRLPGPGGLLNLEDCQFEQHDKRTVRVTGSRFIRDLVYSIKAEGVRKTGYRTVFIAGARDPLFIKQYDTIKQQTLQEVKDYFPEVANGTAKISLKSYGVDGVLGALETNDDFPYEIGIVAEVTASTQESANNIAAYFRSVMMHLDYPNRVSTSGNLALPFAPPEFPAGETFEFSIYHLIEVDDSLSLFPMKTDVLGRT